MEKADEVNDAVDLREACAEVIVVGAVEIEGIAVDVVAVAGIVEVGIVGELDSDVAWVQNAVVVDAVVDMAGGKVAAVVVEEVAGTVEEVAIDGAVVCVGAAATAAEIEAA